MKFSDTSDDAVIDVVEQFDYSTQNEAYNETFITWRRKIDNPYAFNFIRNRKESIFVEGKGFENKSFPVAEQESIGKIMNTAGIAMFLWIVIDNLLSRVAVAVFDFIGFDIHTSFVSTAISGGSTEIVTALILVSLFKLWVPAFYLRLKLKMPKRLELMTTLNHASEMFGAIFMGLAVSAITSLPNIYTNRTRDIFNYFRDINADASVWDQEQFVIYTIFDIIILSILSELFFRGAIFGALRQFGDIFAIIVTSVMSGILVQDFREMPAALLISAVASLGMLRSGSIFTAIFVQAIFKMYRLALVLIEADTTDSLHLMRNGFILIVFMIGAAGAVLLYLARRSSNVHRIAVFSSELSLKERLITAFRTFPVSADICFCILAAAIKIIF
ncbi:MAG: CPBP family intramembrane metalloprotease [Ruminococcus sp.]|uniref:CPBP family intramembrane glutamic endopeptidase n=1 Tax=Ruminococcus sp. TaxID=41978 RepID=UPI001B1203A3|nr:CPBP family intramembrane glutamic endopeptidase [Ruminococcus sp.]MBO7473728.1 CPBP family intramembrane metalloprotease [Ruminococcus sp.]